MKNKILYLAMYSVLACSSATSFVYADVSKQCEEKCKQEVPVKNCTGSADPIACNNENINKRKECKEKCENTPTPSQYPLCNRICNGQETDIKKHCEYITYDHKLRENCIDDIKAGNDNKSISDCLKNCKLVCDQQSASGHCNR